MLRSPPGASAVERAIQFGKYYLLERINVGGMAEVFKAKTVGVEGFEKLVAIKRILPSVAEDEDFIRMFIDEAKITSSLCHANLAQTFDLGRIDEAYYIAMEYVPGRDLRAVLERLKRRGERAPLPVAAYVLARVCEGLDYAHRKQDAAGRDLRIVHRDVSPQNVIVSFEGEVKLIDFGIAKAANKVTRTQAGILKGKFGYMSPEQVRGLPLDLRSDVFAAGAVLYELCTGERLFTGGSDYSILRKVQQAKVTPPTRIEPGVPLRLERVILRALARDPEHRYQTAGEMASDLTRFLLEQGHKPVAREDLAAFMKALFPDAGRVEVGKPTLVGKDPLSSDETTRPSVQRRRRHLVRRAAAPAVAGLVVLGLWWLAPRLITPLPPLEAPLPPVSVAPQVVEPAGELTVRSSPSGATVHLDGVERGTTPVRLPAVDPTVVHAVAVEKRCFRSWQVAIPAHAGARELAATLLPTSGACAGRLEKSAAPPAGIDEGRAAPTIGFLTLGSRPPAGVLIDGVDIGQTTPLSGWPLSAGKHQVELRLPTRSRALAVEIEAGATISEFVDLRAR